MVKNICGMAQRSVLGLKFRIFYNNLKKGKTRNSTTGETFKNISENKENTEQLMNVKEKERK